MPAEQFEDKTTPEPLRKVRPIPGYEESAPEEAYGGGKSGEPAARLAEDSAKIMSQHSDEANEAFLKDSHSRYVDKAIGIVQEAMNIHGKDALAYDDQTNPDSAMNKLDKLEQDTLANTKSDKQRQMLQVMIDDTRNKFHEKLSSHQIEETSYMSIVSSKSEIDKLTRAAVLDPAHVDDYVDADGKKKSGYASQILASGGKKVDAVSAVHQMNDLVIRSLISDGKVSDAEQFAKTHSVGPISENKSLESAKNGAVADAAVDSALKKSNGDVSEAKKIIEETQTGDIKNIAIDKLIKSEKKNEAAIKLTSEKQFEDATKAVLDWQKKHHGMPFNGREVLGGAYDNLGGNDAKLKASMQKAIDAMGDPNGTSDNKLYSEFMANTEGIKSMGRLEFDLQVAQHLKGDELQNAERAYNDMHPKTGSKKDMLASADMRQRLKDALQTGGFYGSDKKKNDARFTMLHDAVQRDIDIAKATGKEPTPKDVQEMINDQVKKTYHRTFRRNEAVFEKLSDVDKDFKSHVQKVKPGITDEEMVDAWDAYNSKDSKTLKAILHGK